MNRTIAKLSVSIFAAVMCFVLLAGGAHAQKWGKVTDEEWAMTPPAEYQDADAIVVFDIGKSIVALGEVEFERHVRIKIFDKSGAADALTVEIPHFKKNKIQSLRAHTLYPEGRKQKVKKKNIHRKKAGGLTVVTFAFPAVENGVILEYSYKIIYTQAIVPEPWIFQSNHYTHRSRFTLSLYPGFDFQWRIQNVPPEAKKPEIVEKNVLTEYTWDAYGLPPAKSEPFTGWRTNYLPSISFRLTSINTSYKKFNMPSSADQLSTVMRVVIKLYTEKSDQRLASLADSLCAGLHADKKKAARLYDFVRDEIETRPGDSIHTLAFLHENIEQLLQKKFGTPSEKNILLLGLMRTQNIDAQPLLIGTRDHAAFQWPECQFWTLNQLLCHVPDYPDGYSLDTGARSLPYPHLPPYDLVEAGLLIEDDDGAYHSMNHRDRKSVREIFSKIALNATGAATCSTHITVSGYEMAAFEELLADPAQHDLIRKTVIQDPDLEFAVRTASAYFDTAADTMRLDLTLAFPRFATVVGTTMLFAPCPFLPRTSPFTAEERMFAVDYQYPFRRTYRTVISLPDSTSVVQLPGESAHDIAGVDYYRDIAESSDSLEVTASISIIEPWFAPSEYRELKDIYDIMIRDATEKIAAEIGENEAATY